VTAAMDFNVVKGMWKRDDEVVGLELEYTKEK